MVRTRIFTLENQQPGGFVWSNALEKRHGPLGTLKRAQRSAAEDGHRALNRHVNSLIFEQDGGKTPVADLGVRQVQRKKSGGIYSASISDGLQECRTISASPGSTDQLEPMVLTNRARDVFFPVQPKPASLPRFDGREHRRLQKGWIHKNIR